MKGRHSSLDVIDVGMLGPMGAGKTSLVTSLYAQFPEITRDLGLDLSATDVVTTRVLQEWLAGLERIAREIVVRETGIPAGRETRDLVFELRRAPSGRRRDAKRGFLAFRFTDYPGGWLFDQASATANDKDEAHLRTRFLDSPFAYIAIDTPALIADEGRYHQEFNAPTTMKDLVRRWLDRPGPRFLVLVPLKCEEWCRSDAETNDLIKRVEDSYADLLTLARLRSHTSAWISPVQTVGSLVFSGFETASGQVVSRFMGKGVNGRFSPAWSAEPLRLLIEDLLHQYLIERPLITRLVTHFGRDRKLRQTLAQLASADYGPSRKVV